MSTPPTRPVPPARGGDDMIMVSPLNPMLPTGYRNIQPFQKGKGWHTNGRTPRLRVASTDSADIDVEKQRGVVFPLLPGHEYARSTQGPDVSAVDAAIFSGDQLDDRQENEATVISPRAPAPPTNGAPRRPSRIETRTSSGGNFRSRLLSASPSSSRPTSPATINDKLRREEEDKASGPDPVVMQQLWQEYAARSHAANRHVDAASYHEKMHRRYGEQRALKERIVQLEQVLEIMESERNEARKQLENATKQLELLTLDKSTLELSDSQSAMRTMRNSLVKSSKDDEVMDFEEKSYRERSFALERALSQVKVSLSTVQEQLRLQTSQASEHIKALEARLALEHKTSLELARQLRELSTSFTRASAELVETRVALEREQQRSQEILEQARLHNAQLMSDTRRTQIESRMKFAVRSLGREALRQKMETLMGRTMRAEHNMRVAQLETERICRERDATREQLEQVLSSSALKYHSLGATGGIPGILERSTSLTNGSRMISDQLLILQVLYEEVEEPEDPEDGFSVHFVAYEPRSAQDDFLTFHLRDIQRLVPNHDSYLARHSVRRRERLESLVELLLNHVHAGYKNGHLVLAETSGPEAATRLPREQLMAQQNQHQTQHVTVYRGTRYFSCLGDENDPVLVELTVSEAFAAATSQVWWLEVRAVLLDDYEKEEMAAKVDLRQLVSFCPTFASYRPTQSHEGNSNDPELFAVHELLLEPLFDSIRVVTEAGTPSKLEVIDIESVSLPSTSGEPQYRQPRLSVENQAEEKMTTVVDLSVPSTLTHQSVVNVGDVFYCVRLQELWDGELLLDITMDNPETQQHFHRVLHEPQLIQLVARLVNDGAIGEDDEQKATALQVKYGLASVLHRPLWKLLDSSIQPVLPHPSQISNKAATEDGEISLGDLLEEEGAETYTIRSMVIQASTGASIGWTYDREVRVITASKNILVDEKAVHQALLDIFTGSTATQVRQHRTGAHFQGESGFSLIQTISTKLSDCGDVTIFDVLSLTVNPSRLPLVLVVDDSNQGPPLQLVLSSLGIEEDGSNFTLEMFIRSQGNRID
ncbi:hypothetical protein P3T76_009335 [Phytophthora citrophthora]|uniref:Uncharacterized protein n=1 Tax=Phytophthora citrophthora TaxID=4793 RepID=A0AAD9GGH1_9STRA|nr:hypothetical protein P3T76_009335 [Phytophthora citrophthora]